MAKQDYARRKSFLAAEDAVLDLNLRGFVPNSIEVTATGASGATVIDVSVSMNGEDWIEIDSFNISAIIDGIKSYKSVGWQFWRVEEVGVTSRDVTLTIAAG